MIKTYLLIYQNIFFRISPAILKQVLNNCLHHPKQFWVSHRSHCYGYYCGDFFYSGALSVCLRVLTSEVGFVLKGMFRLIGFDDIWCLKIFDNSYSLIKESAALQQSFHKISVFQFDIRFVQM